MGKTKTIRAVRYERRGKPLEIVSLQNVSLRELQDGEARVRILYAPINPADINTLEGTYGELRPLPDIPGSEGIGIVEAVSADNHGLKVGDHVLVSAMTWCEEGIWRCRDLVPLSEVLDPVQGAMLRINPASAYCMLKEFHAFSQGEWVAQNAANSGVGRWVAALAKHWKIPAIHFARRHEAVEELIAEGYRHVLCEDEKSVDHAREIMREGSLPLALNAVGGDSAMRLSRMLSAAGTLVTYGAMSKQAFRLSAGALIFKDLRYRGFWVRKSIERMTREECVRMYEELLDLSNRGVIKVPVAEIYPLSAVRDAVKTAMRSGRSGKILLKMEE